MTNISNTNNINNIDLILYEDELNAFNENLQVVNNIVYNSNVKNININNYIKFPFTTKKESIIIFMKLTKLLKDIKLYMCDVDKNPKLKIILDKLDIIKIQMKNLNSFSFNDINDNIEFISVYIENKKNEKLISSILSYNEDINQLFNIIDTQY